MGIREDHRRFRDIVRGHVKRDIQKYVTHGEMIGKREREFVKIPVPSIDLPRFKYGSKNAGGVGQGEGESEPGGAGEQKPGRGPAGEGPGEHHLEAEMSLDELAEILGEQLALPRIEPRGNHGVESRAHAYTGRTTVGPDSLRHFKSSFKEALKRSVASGTYDPSNPYVTPIRRDLRFRSARAVPKPKANAVVIYMMDVSGSMGDEQKEIVRLESFWINAWLNRHYRGLETRFIIHDATAREVDEKTFFSTSESGGTLISSAYQMARQMIEADYPAREWNVYPFHFSDGDNWSGEDTRLCLKLLTDFFLPRVNQFGYGQVESKYGSGQFMKDLEKAFTDDDRLVTSRIESREHIIRSIKDFLGRGR